MIPSKKDQLQGLHLIADEKGDFQPSWENFSQNQKF